MLNRRSTKIVDAVPLLASAAGVLAIAWAEGSLSSGGASGPNFQLIGPDNRTYTRASFPPDSVLVVYFGFTTCWRACPTALNAIGQAVDDLGAAGERVRPIFISLDPQREAPETVDLYLRAFGLLASAGRRIRSGRLPRNLGCRCNASGIQRIRPTIQWSTHRPSSSWSHATRFPSSSGPTVPQKRSVRSW
jgi:hypothetical protein